MGNLGKKTLIEQTKRFNGQDNVNEASKLLAQSTNEDHDILSQLGLSDNDLDAKLESLGEYTRISEYSKEYGYCITKTVIEDIAYKYGLTLGESKYYKFSVPITITADVKEWSKKTGISVSDSSSFFILAPSEAFYSPEEYKHKHSKTKCVNTGGDPMLVHEIAGSSHNGEPVYSLMCEWGSNLNPLRKIRAYVTNRAKTFATLSMLSVIFLITGLVYYVINSMTVGYGGNDWVTIILSLMTFGGMSITAYGVLSPMSCVNIKKKHFNVNALEKNYRIFNIQRFDPFEKEHQFTADFADVVGRFLITTGAISVFFILFFTLGTTSFSDQMQLSRWYFTIPMFTVGSLYVVSLLSRVFQNLRWS